MAFTFDTSLGVALAIALHSLALRVARKYADAQNIAADIADCGTYGAPSPIKLLCLVMPLCNVPPSINSFRASEQAHPRNGSNSGLKLSNGLLL